MNYFFIANITKVINKLNAIYKRHQKIHTNLSTVNPITAVHTNHKNKEKN